MKLKTLMEFVGQGEKQIHVVITGDTVNVFSHVLIILEINQKNLNKEFKSKNIEKRIINKQGIIAFIEYEDIENKTENYNFFRNEHEADEYAIKHHGSVFSVPFGKMGKWNGFTDKNNIHK